MSQAIRHFEGRALASPLRLQVHGGTRRDASVAWSEVIAEFVAVDEALSRHRDDSELTTLNRLAGTGAPRAVDRRTYLAIAAADRARRSTDGRFDARVLADLERLGDRGAALPSVGRVSGAGAGAGRDPRARTVTLDRAHDLGGIGKGLAIRWAADRAARALPVSAGFFLEAGGDLSVRGHPLDGTAWRVAVEDPELDAGPVAVIEVAAGAVCTSSVARRHWRTDDGQDVHHLIDPRTGEPGGAGLLAVSVMGPDPAWAEIWSKALFLEGRRGIGDLARARGLAAWWVEADGALGMTPGARVRTIWTRDAHAQAEVGARS